MREITHKGLAGIMGGLFASDLSAQVLTIMHAIPPEIRGIMGALVYQFVVFLIVTVRVKTNALQARDSNHDDSHLDRVQHLNSGEPPPR